MNSQFKNPLSRKGSPAPQSDAWLVGGAQPAAPGDLSQGDQPPSVPQSTRLGGEPFAPQWQPGGPAPQAPGQAVLAQQQTLKQTLLPPGPISYAPGSPGQLPRTPEAYMQGQPGRYGPAGGVPPMPPAYQNGPQSPVSFAGRPGMGGMGNGPQMFALGQGQYPGAPQGPGGAPGFPQQGGYNSFNQPGPNGLFSMGAVNAPPAPLADTFERGRAGAGTGLPATGAQGYRERRSDGPPSRDPRGGKHKKKRRMPLWARLVIGFLITLIVLLGGGAAATYAYYQFYLSGSVNSIVNQQVARNSGEGDPNSSLTNGILTGPRVNILLLGSDTDQKFQGKFIAQTDIIVTIDPSSHTVGMLSIPRDFFINVPGYGMHKLDEAYGIGGVALSRMTIEQDFGIPINYYAWVGLDGFIKVINEVGGVDVDVLHPIVDDNYPDDVGKNANNPYALKRLYLAPGPQHLDGPSALEYVRSRHADLVGDFGRSVRQQQVLTALKTRLANPDIFNKLSAIAGDLKGYLTTDMALPDVLKLMNFARSLDPGKIDKLTLGPPYSSSGTAPAGGNDAGADVVIPNCDLIVPAIQKMLQLGSKAVCNIATGDNGNSVPQPLTTPTPQASSTSTPQPPYAPDTPQAHPTSPSWNAPWPYATSTPSVYATSTPHFYATSTPQPEATSTPQASSTSTPPTYADGDNLAALFSDSTGSVLSGNLANLFGVQSLLELMLMGTFESTDVF
ncbi:MAG TPA: LCP family protein [Ktedonobacteraceae bacterium]